MKQTLLLSTLLLSLTACQNTNTSILDKNDTLPAKPSITVEADHTTSNTSGNYNKSFHYADFSARVVSTPDGKGGYNLKIQTMGEDMIEKSIDDPVVSAAVGDLNKDGFYEILVFTQSVGSGSYGDVIAYSSNKGMSWSEVFHPELTDKLKQGYMGHDQFALVENVLVRQFPLYLEGDTNANPQGKIRQIQYDMKDGEASRQFVVNEVSEF
ncbi:hypothetical protein [uncultured Psychrobacter sp.]|uniref:hypothetical protein n=1 Tax=uncultured Psychrobacter sp. TaxID=259303 RepID=UPI00260D8E79|nr:hypothetical protein [uncultured Psychrobacter sp.]